MERSIFEQNGGTYARQGDYLLPELKLPETGDYEIGIWGNRHRKWLKAEHRVLYYNLLTKGKLNEHLAEVDRRAEELFLRLVEEMAKQEGVTEKLKVDDMMLWVGRMNNIRDRAAEIVNTEIIYII